ncbi:SDR family NAD(P)-dependent oxidoreductase [Sphingomonas sanxanigenens]|uniref:Gluconate 5-dehydrogenase n=1 Tax=Sphingomonas sanxanigenens DSM 19645 = NX02 TaxID=1123269 RepID=W0A960_9SPHN|nr:SDR family oxidoreductase [Sphingomonas sanxanigenens]AHE53007.1 gluconate 5-dehydrogenase [Sphingomonas sanxanigenens DSM 19645 = NX02]
MPDIGPGFAAAQFRLDGKRALITGGRGALAEAMAATLADLGCAVALASRTEADCAELAASVSRRFRVPTVGLSCNIADEASVEVAVARTIERIGGLDILINNAGASWWGLPQDIPLKGWQKVMDVNVTGTFLACRHAARHMIAQGGGAIVNIASVGAFLSYQPEAGQVVPYTTSKAAIVHLTSDLAAQWAGHNIRVNAIAPGSIETGMTETLDPAIRERTRLGILMRRFGKPQEIGGTLALLASDAGSFITGQTFLVDGGQSLA